MAPSLRLALRALARSPGFSAIAVATLAFGLAANAALFTIVDAVVLEPLPYPASDRLVALRHPVPGIGGGDEWELSAAGYFYFREHNRSFDEIGAFTTSEIVLGGDGPPERVLAALTSASFVQMLGPAPALGRLYTPDENLPNAAGVVVLGHDFWARRYGSDAGIIGRRIEVSGFAYEIVGVLAPGVHLPQTSVDIWLPLGLDPSAEAVNSHYLSAIARLRPGVTAASAQADLISMIQRFPETFPNAYPESFLRNSRFTARVASLRDEVIGEMSGALWILLGSMGLVLLIACANVANLFLVRTEDRRREIAIRSALGATRSSLAGLFLGESMALAAFAAAIAMLLAAIGIRVLLAVAPPTIPRLDQIAMDASTLVFTLALALTCGVVFGAFPLVRFRKGVSQESLREGGRGMTSGRARQRIRHALVVAQVALALVLLMGAGLMVRSFRSLRAIQPGFDARGVLTFDVLLPRSRYQESERAAAFFQQLVAGMQELRLVRAAGATTVLPLKDDPGCYPLFTEQTQPDASGSAGCVPLVVAAAGYFASLAIAVTGREFEPQDNDRSGVVVVSRALAERLWPGRDPIGQSMKPFNGRPPFYRVIGVADDVRSEALDAPAPEIAYFPFLPLPGESSWFLPRSINVVVRTDAADPVSLASEITRAVSSLDPSVAIANVQPMQRVVDRSMTRTSFTMLLLVIAAGIALLLGAVGIYGVISYVVGQRRAEIGVRMALGAHPSQIRNLVVGQSLRLSAAGVALGAIAAFGATRMLGSLLFGVSPTDPLVFAVVSAALVFVACVAAYVPAQRAARVDPATTLRGD
ncbi:MAG: ABC transporter permease [Longimicrobiales bacterium]